MVNAGKNLPRPDSRFRAHPIGTPVFVPPPEHENEFGIEVGGMELAQPKPGDQGPCLYLGPQGQRSGRRALRDGFCAAHMPGASATPSANTPATPSKKIIAAFIAISGLLWPLLSDVVREILRWLHAH